MLVRAGFQDVYKRQGHYFSGAGITFADVGDVRDDLFIQRGDRCGFPVCFGDIGAELFRVSE